MNKYSIMPLNTSYVLKVLRSGSYNHQIQNNNYLCMRRMGQEEDLIREMYTGYCNYIGYVDFLNKCGKSILHHFCP